jgi:type II secretory pathway pseudopilin PulG
VRRGNLLLRGEGGVTLLEIMFALGILMVGTYVVVEGVNQLDESSRQTRNMSTTERQINAIVDNIRTGLGSYQITYDATQAAAMLDPTKLPMAWTSGNIAAVADCAHNHTCPPGRYGFVITPMPNYKGLYTVTLRMTWPDWKEPYRDYKFLATVQ